MQRLSVSAPVMKEEIENLPLNARGVMNLAGIAPGIKTYAPQSGRTLPSGGAAPDLRFFNVYMDGVEMKSLFNGNIVGLGQTGSPLPQEALEQFRVYVNPYDAEYTRAGSYVISAESRRGTNDVAGLGVRVLPEQGPHRAQRLPDRACPNFGRHAGAASTSAARSQKDRLFIAASYELTSTELLPRREPDERAVRRSTRAPSSRRTGTTRLFTRLTYVQSPRVTYDAMGSARFLKGEGNFGARVSQDGGISQDYKIYTGQLRQRYLAPGGNFVNEASLQLVSWNHDETPLKPGPQLTYPGIVLGTRGLPADPQGDAPARSSTARPGTSRAARTS